MSVVQKMLQEAFGEFEVRFTARPGGGMMFALMEGDEVLASRAITADQMRSAEELEWIVHSVRRDLDLRAGQIPSIVGLQSQSRTQLPTYG